MKVAGFYIIILVLLIACVKNAEVKINYKTIPVVNCIFSTDSVWKVYVGLSGDDKNKLGTPVANAIVKVFNQTQIAEQLVYTEGGYYKSALLNQPAILINYRLEVEIPGFAKIIANDYIPDSILNISHVTDTSLISYIYDPFIDAAKVFTTSLKFTDDKPQKHFYMLTPSFYDKNELNIYKVTSSTIDSLKKYNNLFPGDSVKLSAIYDSVYYGITQFGKKLKSLKIAGFRIFKFAKTGNFVNYSNEYFRATTAFAADKNLLQLQDYYYSILGEKAENEILVNNTVNVYFNYFLTPGFGLGYGNVLTNADIEYFIDFQTLSPSCYKYYSTYFKNLTSRTNPFAEGVNVYSNINNGTGIFAGKTNKRIKVF